MRLEDLYAIITKRKKGMLKGSYVVSLIKQGEDAILQKIGEEATEVILAAKGKNKKRIVEEIADLYFMTIVLLAAQGISIESIFEELDIRHKTG